MTETEVIRALGALAQELRLRVFRRLVVAGPTGSTPSQLTEALSVSATALSFHLKELHHAGLITQERQGRHLIYRASFESMNGLLTYLTDNCCQGKSCQVTATDICEMSSEKGFVAQIE